MIITCLATIMSAKISLRRDLISKPSLLLVPTTVLGKVIILKLNSSGFRRRVDTSRKLIIVCTIQSAARNLTK